MKAQKKNAKDIVIDRILEQIENENILPWQKSWKDITNRLVPYNFATGKNYRGANILVLWLLGNRFKVPAYMTYKQAQELGGQVRKGESGFPVLFAQPQVVPLLDKAGKQVMNADGTPATNVYWVNRYYTVFNIEQIDGLDIEEEKTPVTSQAERNEKAEQIIRNTGAVIEYGEPAYYPGKDVITCPNIEDFTTEGNYYASLFHELVHWTGAEHRLNRDIKNSFGNDQYSKEELVAEIGASFLMAHLGIWKETEENNIAYVKGWLSRLKDDKSLILKSATLAQNAVDYILNIKPQVQVTAVETAKAEAI